MCLNCHQEALAQASIGLNPPEILPGLLNLLALPLQIALHAHGQVLHLVHVLPGALQLPLLPHQIIHLPILNILLPLRLRRRILRIVRLLQLPELFADLLEFLFVILDALPDLVALLLILGVLCTIKEVH